MYIEFMNAPYKWVKVIPVQLLRLCQFRVDNCCSRLDILEQNWTSSLLLLFSGFPFDILTSELCHLVFQSMDSGLQHRHI
jgi:hypothetical protein